MKKDGTIEEEKYTRGELSQLARRRMIQKNHGDKSKYRRKTKHKEVMSDSIQKYNQLVEEGVINPDVKAEDIRQQKILDLLAAAAKAGKAGEVELRAREVMKEFGSNSLLLGLEIACQELL